MSDVLVLASGSEARLRLLRAAGVSFEVIPAKIDEAMLRDAMQAEGATPRDIADALAEAKARKIAGKMPGALVLGCDQVLAHGSDILAKPESLDEARIQLQRLRGDRHQLLSAAVIYDGGKPVWRYVGVVRLMMRDFSDAYLDDYLARNWESVRWSVGGYKIEEEGVRLFSRIDGDTFTIQGLPLLELLSYLTLRGTLPT